MSERFKYGLHNKGQFSKVISTINFTLISLSLVSLKSLETTMKPIQSNTVSANVSDQINFLIPGIKKWEIGLP
jgi:hypothetical protein